jgi:1-acyl-sn-glycerol-3-phosphate acyltransferase
MIAKTLFRFDVQNLEEHQKEIGKRNVLILPNHQTALEGFLITLIPQQKVRILMKKRSRGSPSSEASTEILSPFSSTDSVQPV